MPLLDSAEFRTTSGRMRDGDVRHITISPEEAGLRDAPTIREKSMAIIEAVSRGEISVEAGEKVQRMLELHTKAVTVGDLAAEIEQLKRGRATRPPLLPRVDNDLDRFA